MFVKVFIGDFSNSKSTLATMLIWTDIESSHAGQVLWFWAVNALQNFSLLECWYFQTWGDCQRSEFQRNWSLFWTVPESLCQTAQTVCSTWFVHLGSFFFSPFSGYECREQMQSWGFTQKCSQEKNCPHKTWANFKGGWKMIGFISITHDC